MKSCHLCCGILYEITPFSLLHQVTSDCRPWLAGGNLTVCQRCGTVQKPVTEDWLNESQQIYSAYQMYVQGGGVEQASFDADSGTSMARSQKIVSWLTNTTELQENGKLLDIGCGNGAFIRAFASHYPDWMFTGLELDDRNQAAIESIPGVKRLHVGQIGGLNERFDLIVLVHALEHMPNPVKYLSSCMEKLNLGGKILIEVPDLEKSPFDILIADHCSHYSMETLLPVVTTAGFAPLKCSAGFIPKELTLLAYLDNSKKSNPKQRTPLPPDSFSFENNKRVAEIHIEWLRSLLQQGDEVGSRPVGIFGTSISASWLAASLGNKVAFFVDEDNSRVGRTHMGKSIYNPEISPGSCPILMPFRLDIATKIAQRYPNLNIVVPPQMN